MRRLAKVKTPIGGDTNWMRSPVVKVVNHEQCDDVEVWTIESPFLKRADEPEDMTVIRFVAMLNEYLGKKRNIDGAEWSFSIHESFTGTVVAAPHADCQLAVEIPMADIEHLVAAKARYLREEAMVDMIRETTDAEILYTRPQT